MSTIYDALETLLQSQGWEVTMPAPPPLQDNYALVAENDVAVLFASTTTPLELVGDASRLSAVTAATLQSQGGPKAWEVYLLLVVAGLTPGDADAVSMVQRDLTYCRKLVLDMESALMSEDSLGVLARRLALLFPLSLTDTAEAPDPAKLLEDGLIGRGHDPDTVRGLLAALTDPSFDPIEYLGPRLGSES